MKCLLLQGDIVSSFETRAQLQRQWNGEVRNYISQHSNIIDIMFRIDLKSIILRCKNVSCTAKRILIWKFSGNKYLHILLFLMYILSSTSMI